jgi:phosphatidylglycerol:prolipoprotein diacylglycerol transferase
MAMVQPHRKMGRGGNSGADCACPGQSLLSDTIRGWEPVFRYGHAQITESGARPDSIESGRTLKGMACPLSERSMFVLPVIPYPAINPVLFSIGPFSIRWYALAYIVGIIAGWFYARAIIASQRLWGGPAPITVGEFDDFIIWITLGIIVGGRVGYVLLYNLPQFAAHPIQIFELWNGGMSFHGGVFGCVAATVLFALRRGLPMLSLGDVTTAVSPIGLFLGRIANFINGELWGRPTDVPWAMVFPNGGPLPRHPSQLYEAMLEGLVLLIVLGVMVRLGALKRPGLVTGAFFLGYGIARTICEFFREPDAQLQEFTRNMGGLTMGMLLCIPLILAGIGLIALALRRQPIAKNG